MGPQSEGRPSADDRSRGQSWHADDERRYQADRDIGMQDYGGQTNVEDGRRYQTGKDTQIQEASLPRPNGAFGEENRLTASPVGSASGRERGRDGDLAKTSEEYSRPKPKARAGSGQLRLCKKCGEPLTGQFVRALGGTFHLDCFRCRVSEKTLVF